MKLSKKVKFINEYEKENGLIKKDIILIQLTLFGIPIKTIKRFKKQYDGSIIEVDSKYRPI